MKTVIVDYDSGNIKSVANILTSLGESFEITSDAKKILNAEKIIFPGQGHFGQAMKNLEQKGLVPVIKIAINENKKFLGICVGLQILFEESEEAPNVKGLSILKGKVKKFKTGKIPQVGWNYIKTTQNNKYLTNDYFYFVNSYYIEPENTEIVSSYSDYYIKFASSVSVGNLTAVQFHPEKSAQSGYEFFKSWLL